MAEPAPSSGEASAKERGRRFLIEVPLHYRGKLEGTWRKGQTENLSRSGVLFRGELLVEPTTLIEIRMVLPTGISGEDVVELLCEGTVVRTILPSSVESMPRLATTISHYRLIRL